MKSIRQLLRQPGKTLFGVFLVALGMTLLCVSVGQYYSAMETRNNLDSQYTTVALPANVREYDPSRVEFGHFDGNFFRAQQEYSAIKLEDIVEDNPKLVKAISNASHASAYSPGLVTDLPIDHPYFASHYCNGSGTAPYNTAVLEVELTGSVEIIGQYTIPTPDPDGSHSENSPNMTVYTFSFEATILRDMSLHPGFRDPEGWTLRGNLIVDDLQELEDLELEVGQRYLMYTDDYCDWDWELRKQKSGLIPFLQEFDRTLLETPEDGEVVQIDMVTGQQAEVMAYRVSRLFDGKYPDIYLGMNEVAQIECVLAQDMRNPGNTYDINGGYPHVPGQEQILLNMDGSTVTLSWEEYESYYSHPTFVKLTGTAEEYLASEEAELWHTVMEETAINNSSVPVIGVEKLGYLADFVRNLVRITEGRDFTDEELADGAKVCVISETLAQMNGLEVGDTLPLQFYDYDSNLSQHASYNLIGEATQNPSAFYYSRRLGFSSDLRVCRMFSFITTRDIPRSRQAWRPMTAPPAIHFSSPLPAGW